MLNEAEIKQLLQKLAANEATEAEQRLLDSAADHDEFLKEVLEGYRSTKSVQSPHLKNLQERIDARVSEKKERKIIPLPWRSIAAAVILFLGVGIWMVVGSLQSDSTSLAMDLDSEDAIPESAPLSESEATSPTARSIESRKQMAETELESDVAAPAATQKARQDKASLQENTTPEEAAGVQAPPPETPNYDKVIYLTEGQVFGRGDKPLGGAKITLVDHDITTYSDLQGRFLLPLKKVNGRITILHPQYESKSLPSVNTMAIASLSLSALSAKTALSKSDADQNPAPATPVPGWRGLARYIGQNLKFPPEAAALNMYASVELTFTISADGQPQGIKVKNPVGYGFDEEAIRLLSEGPKWNPARDPKEVIYYIVNF